MSCAYLRLQRWRALNKTPKVLKKTKSPVVNDQNLNKQSGCVSDCVSDCVSEVNDLNPSDTCNLQFNIHGDHDNEEDSISAYSDADSKISGNEGYENNHDLEDQLPGNSEPSFVDNSGKVVRKKGLNEKLRSWALKNINTLRLNVVTELLTILREEGHEDLPKTSKQLLRTKHCRPMKTLVSKRETSGSYIYIGIKNVLQKIISSDIYSEQTIAIQLHIDGISIFNNSSIQVWPIILKVYHRNYESKPVTVALYCGDSKPYSAKNYLKDLVKEANEYISNGIVLNEIKYSFKIFCIVADSPARAFIKAIKNPGGFFACERCTVEGMTKNRKRVYPDMDCSLRTKESFIEKQQPDHHLTYFKTKLTKLIEFDPVHDVALDSMHLLYLGVMKNLLEKLLIVKKHNARLKKPKVDILRQRMQSIGGDIPVEFARKKFDIDQVSKWKATQFRFFLLYIGPIIFKDVLSENKYRHFLLLYVSSRILNDDLNAVRCAPYAQDQLRLFFNLLPSEYGEDAQVLNMHNLIHLPDDVRHFQVPLSEISAFWGEDYIGFFKHLVKSPYKPLTQIANRLEELESSGDVKIMKKSTLCECFYGRVIETINCNQTDYIMIEKVKFGGITLTCKHPNNVIKLKNNKIFVINNILNVQKNYVAQETFNNLYIYGIMEEKSREFFDYPTSSIDVGLTEIISWKKQKILLSLNQVSHKCIFLNINDSKFAITLLHI